MWDLKELNTDMALYMALADAMERDIKKGVLKPGDQLPPQRELAKKVGVNVTTVTRAYKEAESRGLITAVVGQGTFVSKDLGANSSLINMNVGNIEASYYTPIDMGFAKPLCCLDPSIKKVLQTVTNDKQLMDYMNYTPPSGLLPHRQVGALWLKRFGLCKDPSQILITAGGHHALDCILFALFKPEEHIAVDCYTYSGFKMIAKRRGVRLEPVEMDEKGMLPDSLEKLCHRLPIKGIYTMPSIQNPTCCHPSSKRIEDLAQIIAKHHLISIEDAMYGHLSEEPTYSIASLLPESSLFIAGLSKAFYPGLRVSFVYSPAPFYNKICQQIIDTMWMAPTLNAAIACECITSGLADEILALKKVELEKRAKLLATTLSNHPYTYYPGSLFAWVPLPSEWESDDFVKECQLYGTSVVPAEKFIVGNLSPLAAIRLSLSAAHSFEEFQKGLSIIATLLNRGPQVNGIL